jgi:hypothetical protein
MATKLRIPTDQLRPSYLALFRRGEFVEVMAHPDARASIIKSYERINDEFTVRPISPETARKLRRERPEAARTDFAVAFIMNGKTVAIACEAKTKDDATDLMNYLNDQFAGSALSAKVIDRSEAPRQRRAKAK